MELKIYGRSEDILGKPWISEDAQSNRNLQPSSIYAKYIISSLTKKTTKELMNIAFRTVEISRYGVLIREHFFNNTGRTLNFRMNDWYNFPTGLSVPKGSLKSNIFYRTLSGQLFIIFQLAINLAVPSNNQLNYYIYINSHSKHILILPDFDVDILTFIGSFLHSSKQ